jgi:hypothetical protein
MRELEFLIYVVTPAKAGVQKVLNRLDTGFRRYDDLVNFRRNSKLDGPDGLISVREEYAWPPIFIKPQRFLTFPNHKAIFKPARGKYKFTS